MRASFMIVSDLNGHHQDWLVSTTTNRHGVAAFDCVRLRSVGCRPNPCMRGGTLDFHMTDVPDLVRVNVVAPIDDSDLSSLSAVI